MSSGAEPALASAWAERWPELRWRWRRFERLGVRDLQAILAVRQRVFALEQNCVFLDIDGLDEHAAHLAAWAPGEPEPLAYARVLDPGVKYREPSIGRVLTATHARGVGLGREVFARALARARRDWPGHGVRIAAQSRLELFYGGFGFVVAGGRYLEDGIDHTEMLVPESEISVRAAKK